MISDSRSPSSDAIQLHRTVRNQPSPPNGLLDEAALADVKVHYCSQVYEAVVIAIRESLHALGRKLNWRQSTNVDRYNCDASFESCIYASNTISM